MVMRGSTSQPVNRSITTDAKLFSPLTPCWIRSRLMRRTSPPIVVGNTLETNWPAK
jgi:hypothetical protein